MRINVFLKAVFFTAILIFSANAAFAADKTAEPSDVEQTKTEILKHIGTIELGLVEFRHCITVAKTEEEILKCHEELRIRRFYEVQDILYELGLERQERELRRLVPVRP